MKCPYCNSSSTKMIASSLKSGFKRRYYECNNCQNRYYTTELIETRKEFNEREKQFYEWFDIAECGLPEKSGFYEIAFTIGQNAEDFYYNFAEYKANEGNWECGVLDKWKSANVVAYRRVKEFVK